MTTLFDDDLVAPAGSLDRFGSRWRMVGAGLSDVWRYGDLVLDAPSGRLLLRGPNGTGKTTALEALWPFLLDLNRKLMQAGKARNTSLRSLMHEGATSRRRVGYLWMVLAEPVTNAEHSFGVRVDYSESVAPTLLPFTVAGRPLRELALHGPGRASLTAAAFEQAVRDAGGQTFDEPGYVAHLAARVWGTTPDALAELATRLRALRNPSTLAAMSPREAADALREALPAVDPRVVNQTGDALAESDTTREAFARDADAAEALADFSTAWAGHVVDVVGKAHGRLVEAGSKLSGINNQIAAASTEREAARVRLAGISAEAGRVEQAHDSAAETVAALKASQAYGQAQELHSRQSEARRGMESAEAALRRATEGTDRRRGLLGVLRRDLDELPGTLGDLSQDAQGLDSEAVGMAVPSVRYTAAQPVHVGTHMLDPGPDVELFVDDSELTGAVTQWRARAQELKTRAGAAALALTDHVERVFPLAQAAQVAQAAAANAASVLEDVRERLARRTTAARTAVTALIDVLRIWAGDPENLALLTATTGHTDVEEWAPHLLDELGGDEPGLIIAQVQEWARTVTETALARAAELRQQAKVAREEADEHEKLAAATRRRAAELRAGRTLPLPRPAWAAAMAERTGINPEEETLFGSALAWVDGVTPQVADRIESAMAAAGLLGAQLDSGGLSHPDWVVHPTGSRAPAPMLSSVVRADPDHPLARVAAAVLDRIHLAESTDQPVHTVTVATDATFVLGNLRGHAPGSRPDDLLPEASHIGAARRLAAALAHAQALDAEADTAEEAARGLRGVANEHLTAAKAVSERHRSFPSTDLAYRAETGRSTAAEDEARREREYRSRESEATSARIELDAAAGEWAHRTRAAGLPADPTTLGELERSLRERATQLGDLAGHLERTATRTLPQLRDRVADLDLAPVLGAIAEARDLHQRADVAATTFANLQAAVGGAAAAVAQAIGDAERQIIELAAEGRRLLNERTSQQRLVDVAVGKLSALDPALTAAQAAAEEASIALVRLLRAPGVSAVLVGSAPADQWWASSLAGTVGAALAGKPARGQRGLTDRYDPTRARLGDAWSLHPGDLVDGLLTYELVHRDILYDPAGAAGHAAALAEQARAALNSAEDEALRRFVIGMLPQAIGQAWQGMFDWVNEVNTKMRAAAASSGLKVVVRAPKREDLNPAEQTVIALACKMSEADRTEEQTRALGEALRSLIDAADGVTMTERVAAAVDVRQWVNIVYFIDRGNGKEERWGSRTGLSGGERRLVVLAPVLAAVAAGYDALGSTGLRLAALDEVPAEVDERGREGLARFTATLDLDLIATSYLWDGAPGAWDGIEAWDLEAGSDGTVVAFLMSVRGVTRLPGEAQELA